MQQKILHQVEQAILGSKTRNPSSDIEDLKKFLRYFEFSMRKENAESISLEYRRAAWRRFMQEAATQNVIFDLKNSAAYYSLQREFIGIKTGQEPVLSENHQLDFFEFEKSRSA